MNNKGFAISGILYSILIIFVVSIAVMLFNLQNRKTVLDEIKVDAVEAVNFDSSIDYLTERINALEEVITQGGADGNTVRYNEETDYVQVYANNEWVDWKKAFLKRTYLYDNGYVNSDLVGGYEALAYRASGSTVSVSIPKLTLGDTAMTITAPSNNNVGSIFTKNKIDLTNITTITIVNQGSTESGGILFKVALDKQNEFTVIKSSSYIVGGITTLNVEDLTGSYYICFEIWAGRSATISEIYME